MSPPGDLCLLSSVGKNVGREGTWVISTWWLSVQKGQSQIGPRGWQIFKMSCFCSLLTSGPQVRSKAQGMMKNLSCVSHFLRLKPRVVPGYVSNTGKESPLGPRKKINLSLKAKGFFFLRFLHMGTHLSTQTFFFSWPRHMACRVLAPYQRWKLYSLQ